MQSLEFHLALLRSDLKSVYLVVSLCGSRDHSPTYLGRGHPVLCFVCLTVILRQRPKSFARNFTSLVHPRLLSPFFVLQISRGRRRNSYLQRRRRPPAPRAAAGPSRHALLPLLLRYTLCLSAPAALPCLALLQLLTRASSQAFPSLTPPQPCRASLEEPIVGPARRRWSLCQG